MNEKKKKKEKKQISEKLSTIHFAAMSEKLKHQRNGWLADEYKCEKVEHFSLSFHFYHQHPFPSHFEG